ncbi:PE-PPE domain-containing protein [Gordonia sp. (in: high G+C Gram-positive bacteria)]|uniref:PE-PPE domain-containing protein n=1 Tax=Gordonia sp. (in: high G+C Gram-positive bacteria) TaxID=84139 RepID=UPI003C743B86
MKRGRIATSVAACGICAGLVVPGALATANPLPAAFDQSVGTLGEQLTADHDQLGDWVPNADNAFVVVVPGTDDDRSPRINDLVGERESLIVNYPESFFPVIAGKSGKLPFFAPTYDKSRSVATNNTLAVMEALKDADDVIVYTGYSQGSDALGNAVEQAPPGTLGPNSTIVLVSDPRSPWGIKSFGKKVPFADQVLKVIGIDNDGARDPAKAGDAKVVHVIVQGDPVANTQWIWYRPVSSLAVNGLGFLTIHSGTGPYTYAHTENLNHVKTLQSDDGNSTYEIYDTYHPIALFNAMIYDALGLPVSQTQLERWDASAELFYPTQEVSVSNADPKVKVHEVPLSSGSPVSAPTVPEAGDPATDASDGESTLRSASEPKHQLVDEQGDPVTNDYGPGFTAPSHAAPDAPVTEDLSQQGPVSDSSDAQAPVEPVGDIAGVDAAGDTSSDESLTPAA